MRIISITFFLTVTLLSTVPVLGQDNSSWPIFHGNQGLSGSTPVIIPKSPKLVWTFKATSGIKSSPVIGNNSIFIGSDDGKIYCLSLAGKLIWTFTAGNTIEAPPMYYDYSVYAGTLEGKLLAIDAKTGKQRWVYATEGQISGSPNYFLSGSNKKILAGSYDNSLYCINDVTGKPDWKYTSDNYINCSPAVSGKYTIFGGCDGNMHVVDLASGTLNARHNPK